MKRFFKHTLLLVILASCLLTGSSYAEISRLIRYQGVLTDKITGQPLPSGDYQATFSIYNASEEGDLLWQEGPRTIFLSSGTFSTLLGEVNPVDLDWDEDCWLAIMLQGENEMSPRQRITPVPIAIKAEEAERLSGEAFYIDLKTGNVGIGTTSPQAKLEVSGGINDKVRLLLHCNAPSFSDEIMNRAVTVYGDAQIDISDYKFGGASGLFDGDGDYLVLEDSDDWNFGYGDFTIDLWVRFDGLPTGNTILLTQHQSAVDYWQLSVNSSTNVTFHSYINNSEVVTMNAATGIIADIWHHLAVARNSNTYRLFLDGNQIGADVINSNPMPDLDGDLYIGASGADSYFFNGHIDEIRIVKGEAQWISNFTPPDNEYNSIFSAIFSGKVKAKEFVTGDITFQKNGEALWRMFEDGYGLYLESVKTNKIYRILTQELTKDEINDNL